MVEQQTDYSQAYDFLYKMERRITLLEKDAAFIERQIGSLDIKKLKTFSILDIELQELRSTLSELKSKLNNCAHKMSTLSKEMKDAVKNDDIQILNSALDDVKFEEYVTKRDVNRGLI
jgi:uncharacterized coiled-coil protein SlyX